MQLDVDNQPENDEYEIFADAEDFEDYSQDGYHPVFLGESFNQGKYTVVQKLGWGHFSTVWLVRENTSTRHFALKIQKSKPSYQESALDELKLLQDLRKRETDAKWNDFVNTFNSPEQQEKFYKNKQQLSLENTYTVRLQDNFVHFGMHGKHYCSVFNVMGPTLLDVIQHFENEDKYIEEWLVKLITRQVLIGLVYVHDVCQMIHTDIKPENIMIDLQDKDLEVLVQKLTKYNKKPLSMKFLAKIKESGNASKNKKKYEKKKLKKKQKAAAAASATTTTNAEDQEDNAEELPVSSSQQSTEISVQEQQQNSNSLQGKEEDDGDNEWVDCSEHENLYSLIWKNDIVISLDSNLKVKIVDFGNACWVQQHFTDRIQTREYRAPEAILKADYNATTDVWSLACMVYEMLTNEFLFKPHKREGQYKKGDDHLRLIQDTIGKIPKHIALKGKKSRDFFNKNGQLIRIKDSERTSISERLIKDHKYSSDSAKQIEDFLLPMLEYDIKKRVSAREALTHPWLWN